MSGQEVVSLSPLPAAPLMNPFQMSDAGTYTLVAENKNGIDKVPMDLIVLDPMNDCECNMFKSVDLQCHCSLEFRYE